MIYVTVGTMFLDFPRLIRKMDEIARDTGERVVIQTGMGKTIPEHGEWFDFKPREEVLAIQRDARVIVCHAGIGSVLDALQARRPLLVVPRLRKFKEHMTDHQLDVAEAVERRGWGRMILDVADLSDACAHPPEIAVSYEPARDRLVAAVRSVVERVVARRNQESGVRSQESGVRSQESEDRRQETEDRRQTASSSFPPTPSSFPRKRESRETRDD